MSTTGSGEANSAWKASTGLAIISLVFPAWRKACASTVGLMEWAGVSWLDAKLVRMRRPLAGAPGLKNAHDFRCLPMGENGVTGLHDTDFLGGDIRQAVAQDLRVIQTDVGDNADLVGPRDDVGAVVQTAQADLDDRVIHLL